MGNRIKFNSLTPEILSENQTVYTAALDYVFANNDIKNIAITGIYGAGKSSVWKTYYEKQNNLEDAITVSLGKYEDNLVDELIDNNNQDGENDIDKYENRLEKQIINQILAQIPAKKIPLSTYKFKENRPVYKLVIQVLFTMIFIGSIFLWMFKDDATLNAIAQGWFGKDVAIWTTGICAVLFFIPISYFLYGFYKNNKIRLSRINVKGAEANLREDDGKDETILDRDIKEIVYALCSSSTKVVVFEDLDRYENIRIFTKLRELNFWSIRI